MILEKSLEDYRQGAAGSIFDEYERAMCEIKAILQKASAADYGRIVEGEDAHCRSIEIIMNHVVRSGYFYANYIRDALAMKTFPVADKQISQTKIADEIDKMLDYTAGIFEGRWQTFSEEMMSVVINARWGTNYNVDQMLEHAIVHALRHRRQIEKFLLKFNS